MIIDTQVHILEKAHANDRGVRMHYTWHPMSAELLLDEMDYAGVDKCFFISYTAEDIWPDLGDAWNDPAANRITKEYFLDALPGNTDRLIWFTDHITPDRPGYLDRIREDLDAGAVGLKIFPAYRGHLPSDPGLRKVYEICAERDVPIIMAWERWNDPRLRACVSDYQEFLDLFEPVARDFPTVKFLLTHWGCFTWGDLWLQNFRPPFPLLDPFVRLLNRHEHLYTDIAAVTIFFGDEMAWTNGRMEGPEWEYPYANGLALLEGLVRGAGAERVMWGTDWPWTATSVARRSPVPGVRSSSRSPSSRRKATDGCPMAACVTTSITWPSSVRSAFRNWRRAGIDRNNARTVTCVPTGPP